VLGAFFATIVSSFARNEVYAPDKMDKLQGINNAKELFLILNKITQIKGFTGFVPSDNPVNLLIRLILFKACRGQITDGCVERTLCLLN